MISLHTESFNALIIILFGIRAVNYKFKTPSLET